MLASQIVVADMDELYLIAHRVRGQPAFDIAIRVQIGDEDGWIVPTSGHRAYPWAAFLLKDHLGPWVFFSPNDIPDDWPDHYSTTSEAKQTGAELLEELGFKARAGKHPGGFVRRI